jgi:hypothetical protein
MNINNFKTKRPYLYHLTDRRNYEQIKDCKTLFSTKSLVEMSNVDLRDGLLNRRRPCHTEIKVDGRSIFLRDQRPISLNALSKCLTDGWTCGDYIFHLNSRVFFWPTINRLVRHFERYKSENPIILKISTGELFSINAEAEFCRLNSGATRCNSYLGGIPPYRGKQTFQKAEEFDNPISTVAEVTFPDKCAIPPTIAISSDPTGNWIEEHLP